LFEPSPDHILAGSFDLAAADRTARRKAIGVIQVVSV